MKHLENFTATEVINYLAESEASRLNVSKALAKKLVINALTYNVVTAEISSQVDFLLSYEENE